MDDVVNGNSVAPWYGLEALADGTAIFVAPNGINNGWANEGGADIAFVDSIIEQIESDLCVDQSSRFATGFSYGGGMSYSIACSRAGDFRAVAPMAAGLISGCDGGSDPIAYLGIHGISDDVLPISGGIELAKTFVENNGCQAQEVGQPAPGSGESVRTDFEGCSEPVSFIAWDGGHVGAPFGADNPLAPEATWEFFNSLSGQAASISTGAGAGSNSTASAAPAAGSSESASDDSTGEAPTSEDSQTPSEASDANAGEQSAGDNPWEQGGQDGQPAGHWKPWSA